MQPGVLKVVLALTGIFVAGGIVGGVGGVAWERHQERVLSDRAFADKQLKRLIGSLELTADQVQCMRPVMHEFAERIRVARRNAFSEVGQVWREINAQIERELTPKQLTKFREIQAQDLERWEREQSRRCPPPAAGQATTDLPADPAAAPADAGTIKVPLPPSQ